jgi:hypothetical protein
MRRGRRSCGHVALRGAEPSMARPIGPFSLYWRCRIQGADAFRAGELITACPYGHSRQFSGRAWRDGWRSAAARAGVKLPHELDAVFP